jgi:hypothetical protein
MDSAESRIARLNCSQAGRLISKRCFRSSARSFPKFGKIEPAYGMGDSQFWKELRRLSDVTEPLIAITAPDDQTSVFKSNQFHDAHLRLTEPGSAVLAGERDFIERNGIDHWLGGVHLTDTSLWKWNEEKSELVHVA